MLIAYECVGPHIFTDVHVFVSSYNNSLCCSLQTRLHNKSKANYAYYLQICCCRKQVNLTQLISLVVKCDGSMQLAWTVCYLTMKKWWACSVIATLLQHDAQTKLGHLVRPH